MRLLLSTASLVLLVPLVGAAAATTAPLVPAYEVTVALSEAAAQKLAGSGEGISISAYYFGDPIKAKDANESGDYSLGDEQKDGLAPGTVTLGHVPVTARDLKKVKGHQPSVLINVFTSRKVFENNLLACDIFQDLVSVAAEKGVAITCKLIGE